MVAMISAEHRSGIKTIDMLQLASGRLSRNEDEVMLVGWALLPVPEFESTNSYGRECPSYESSTTQVVLPCYLDALTLDDITILQIGQLGVLIVG
jgi:hypothetical protein